MIKLTEQYLINILKEELALLDDQIWIRNQNKVIPNDNKLYVIVGLSDAMMMSVTNESVSVPEGLNEVQKIVMRENIQIDILSRDIQAVQRRYEVIAALRSVYAQQVQELNEFKIFKFSQSFINSSDAEGGSNINRFTIVIPCHTWYRKEKLISGYDYYDDFKTRVDDEASIETDTGIIEFEIDENTPAPVIN